MLSLIERIRNAMAAGLTALAVAGGAAMLPTETATGDVIAVGAFNVQVFGKTKAAKLDVMDTLVTVLKQFDIVVIQEVRDSRELVADELLDRLNAAPGFHYRMVEGPRLGRSTSKEQYVIYYTPASVELTNWYTLPDEEDAFEREPIVASFRSGDFDFTVVGVHIKPDDAEDELGSLAAVGDAIRQADTNEHDVILLGDFNADCSYFDEDDMTHPLRATGFQWLIGNEMETAVTSGCTYDRIVVFDDTFSKEFVAGTASVVSYDDDLGITDLDFVKKVSDHYPVVAEFKTSLGDDD
jgi:endonuclease/exonuclease/phosphatase family metal-dependent hydrolase